MLSNFYLSFLSINEKFHLISFNSLSSILMLIIIYNLTVILSLKIDYDHDEISFLLIHSLLNFFKIEYRCEFFMLKKDIFLLIF